MVIIVLSLSHWSSFYFRSTVSESTSILINLAKSCLLLACIAFWLSSLLLVFLGPTMLFRKPYVKLSLRKRQKFFSLCTFHQSLGQALSQLISTLLSMHGLVWYSDFFVLCPALSPVDGWQWIHGSCTTEWFPHWHHPLWRTFIRACPWQHINTLLDIQWCPRCHCFDRLCSVFITIIKGFCESMGYVLLSYTVKKIGRFLYP